MHTESVVQDTVWKLDINSAGHESPCFYDILSLIQPRPETVESILHQNLPLQEPLLS
jgi:hypothetical protein